MGFKKTVFSVFLICLLVIARGAVFLFFHWPQIYSYLNGMAIHGNRDRRKAFVLSYGIWAPLVSACLMVAQSVILFLPAFPIFVVNALVFGLLWGMLLTRSSAVRGFITCFAIAKTLGRPVVHGMVNRAHLETADAARFILHSVLWARACRFT